MNGTIICAVDESEGASAAIKVSKELARRFETRMLLVSIAGDSAALDDSDEVLRIEIAAGDPAEAVARIADEEAADLIVVGARFGLFGRPVQSPLATELAATARCPVVVVPPDPFRAPARRVPHRSFTPWPG